MAFIGIRVPEAVGRMLESVEVPGERSKTSDMHITLLYLGRNAGIIPIAKAMVATHAVVSKYRPFLVTGITVDSFPSNPDDGIPVIVPIESQPLHVFRHSLASKFDELGLEYSKKYPEFHPHVTLSYVKDPQDGFTVPVQNLPGYAAWVVNEITIWGGEDMGDGAIVTLPLPMSAGALGVFEVASRIANTSR